MRGAERHHRGRTGGFTVLELMVALTIGGIALSSIYAIGAASTRNFSQQMQIANAQTALRSAINQVKRDITRAGYLATPNITRAEEGCGPVNTSYSDPANSGELAAFSFYNNDFFQSGVNGGLRPDGSMNNHDNGFTSDELVLFANYETTAEYPGVGMVGPNVITVSQNWHAFQRDFTDWAMNGSAGSFSATAFGEAFAPNRLVRIRTTKGQKFFSQLVGFTDPGGPAPVQLSLSDSIPSDCQDDITGGWVAPVSAIRYGIEDAPSNDEGAEAAVATGTVTQLVRTEVWPTNKVAPLNGSARRSILDFAVAFKLMFNVASNVDGSYAPGADGGWVFGSALANPEQVRSVWIEIAARSPEQDPRFPWESALCGPGTGITPPAINNPPTLAGRCFQVFPAQAGSARVRVARAEVFVPNVAYEGYF